MSSEQHFPALMSKSNEGKLCNSCFQGRSQVPTVFYVAVTHSNDGSLEVRLELLATSMPTQLILEWNQEHQSTKSVPTGGQQTMEMVAGLYTWLICSPCYCPMT